MFASVRNNQIAQQQAQKKIFEQSNRDSYQACGTFGFSRKDLKLSEDLQESIESTGKQVKQNPWKSMQVNKLDLSQAINQKHLHAMKPIDSLAMTNENQN